MIVAWFGARSLVSLGRFPSRPRICFPLVASASPRLTSSMVRVFLLPRHLGGRAGLGRGPAVLDAAAGEGNEPGSCPRSSTTFRLVKEPGEDDSSPPSLSLP